MKRKKDGWAHTARTQSAVRGGKTRDGVGISDVLYVLRWRSMSALRRRSLKNTVVKSALSSELVRVTAYLLISSGGAINFSRHPMRIFKMTDDVMDVGKVRVTHNAFSRLLFL